MKLKSLPLLFPLVLLVFSSCGTKNQPIDNTIPPQAAYVGREACKDCHQLQYEQFIGSDHDMAMDVATDETVLGDFNDVVFEHLGVRSHFYKKDGEFYVNTEGPDGALEDFQIKYVFGVRPLQQYLVEFPGGRFQVLPLCWDARPKEQGGRRWFHIYGQERIPPNDILYWTRMAQNWNYMCSECHSTNVRKNYDRFKKEYRTGWSEIDVSCEACHGPGSDHVAWAQAAQKGQKTDVSGYLGLAVRLKDADNATWVLRDREKGTAERTAPRKDRTLVDVCGRCHSRRSVISENYVFGKSLLDTHRPSVLEENLYFPDGQIQDEVYVYGSFLQSKMYNAGVVCKDCHEPHSGKVYIQGNALCYRCHAPSKFGVREHHFHDPEKKGGLCVECHMPERTYMVIDPRRDHSMRVPRPDLSDRLETPNACTKCHSEKSDQWAAGYTRKWYGDEKPHHYGETFFSARRRYPEALDDLIRLANNRENAPMVRATALSLLQAYPSDGTLDALKRAVKDPDPLIRAAAVGSADIIDINSRFPIIKHLLRDSVRLVRVQTAQSLADVPDRLMTRQDKTLLQHVLDEYRETQFINADHETAYLNLAVLALRQGDRQKAEEYYKKAIAIEPLFAYSYINLADLYRAQGRDKEGEKLLLQALGQNPNMAEVHHALGLLYVRQRRLDLALKHLEKAATLSPQIARFAYVYAIALNSTNRATQALQTLTEALKRHPYDRDLLMALATINRDQGSYRSALEYAMRLVESYPENEDYRQMAEQLRHLTRPGNRKKDDVL